MSTGLTEPFEKRDSMQSSKLNNTEQEYTALLEPKLNKSALTTDLTYEDTAYLGNLVHKLDPSKVEKVVPLDNMCAEHGGFVMQVSKTIPAHKLLNDSYGVVAFYPLKYADGEKGLSIARTLGFEDSTLSRDVVNKKLPGTLFASKTSFPISEFVARVNPEHGVFTEERFRKNKDKLPAESQSSPIWEPSLGNKGAISAVKYSTPEGNTAYGLVVECNADDFERGLSQIAETQNIHIGDLLSKNTMNMLKTQVHMNADALAYRALDSLGLLEYAGQIDNNSYSPHKVVVNTGSEKFLMPKYRTVVNNVRFMDDDEKRTFHGSANADVLVFRNAIDLRQSPTGSVFKKGAPYGFQLLVPFDTTKEANITQEELIRDNRLHNFKNLFFNAIPAEVRHTSNLSSSTLGGKGHESDKEKYAKRVAWTNEDDSHIHRKLRFPATRDTPYLSHESKMGWNPQWSKTDFHMGISKVAQDDNSNLELNDVIDHSYKMPTNYYYNGALDDKIIPKGTETLDDFTFNFPTHIPVPCESGIIPQIAKHYTQLKKKMVQDGIQPYTLAEIFGQDDGKGNLKLDIGLLADLKDIVKKENDDISAGKYDLVKQSTERSAVLNGGCQ